MTWKIELPTGEFLDTPPNFALQFELNNQVFSSSDTTALPGSFSFPVDLALTPKNRALLSNIGRIDAVKRIKKIEGVWAYAGGKRLFYGVLNIVNSTDTSVKLTLVSNPVASLKSVNLPKLDLEGNRTVAPSSWEDHMKATVNNPEDFDYIFMPVLNEGSAPAWNFWNGLDEVFIESVSIVTPFIKLKYLLDRIFSIADGWQFRNRWQANDLELGRLYVFNNADARVIADTVSPSVALPDSFSLNKHLPNITCADFLKRLAAQWGLGVFANIFEKTISIVSLNEILSRQTKHDWTQYALKGIELDNPIDIPGYYNYPQVNGLPPNVDVVENATLLRTSTEYEAGLPLDPGNYYVETLSVYQYVGTGVYDGEYYGLQHRGVRVGDGPDYQSGMEAIFDQIDAYRWPGDYSGFDTDFKWQNVDYPIALMFFRGLQNVIIGADRSPLCGNSVWLDGVGTPGDKAKLVTAGVEVGEATQSLNWFGEYGLYAKCHAAWSELLRNGKYMTQSFHLPLSVLTSFSFEDKIRVGNIDFFATRIRVIKLLDRGRVLVEASLISTI